MSRLAFFPLVLLCCLLTGCGEKDPVSSGPGGPPAGMMFEGQIAPMLVSRCGKCHIEDSKGGLSMASFASLMKGSKKGAVLVAGKPEESKLIEMVETGKMPPKQKLSDPEIAMLKDWIKEGATFTGDQQMKLKDLMPPGMPPGIPGGPPGFPPGPGMQGGPPMPPVPPGPPGGQPPVPGRPPQN